MTNRYVLFTTPTCVACPPVKKLLAEMEAKGLLRGENINVASDDGIEKATEFGIMSSPTVVFFDETNREIARANSVTEVKSIVYDY